MISLFIDVFTRLCGQRLGVICKKKKKKPRFPVQTRSEPKNATRIFRMIIRVFDNAKTVNDIIIL